VSSVMLEDRPGGSLTAAEEAPRPRTRLRVAARQLTEYPRREVVPVHRLRVQASGCVLRRRRKIIPAAMIEARPGSQATGRAVQGTAIRGMIGSQLKAASARAP
jgi:hypothetical protein